MQIKITLNDDEFNKEELTKMIIKKIGENNRSLFFKNLLREHIKSCNSREAYLRRLSWWG